MEYFRLVSLVEIKNLSDMVLFVKSQILWLEIYLYTYVFIAEESIKRYNDIESQSGLEFFDPVGFLSVWKKSDLSTEYLEEITTRAKETQSTFVTNDYAATNFPYLRYAEISW